MSDHSSLGPSQAKRWIECPGSVTLCAKAPPRAPNENAAQGTVAHDIAEKFVTEKIDSLDMMAMIGTTRKQEGFDIEIIEEMFDGAVEYKELIESDRAAFKPKPAGVQGHAEVEVHATSVDERVWGTSDYVLFQKGDKLIVYDYKFGQGVIVDPEENEQGALYLIGVMDSLAGEAFDELEIVIHQPRGRHADGPVRRWKVPKEWLAMFRAKAKAAAAETLRPDARIIAGNHCRWCAAKPFCPVIHKGAQEAAMVAFDAVAPLTPLKAVERLPEVRLLPLAQLGKMLEWEGAVKSLFEAVKDVVRERLNAGESVPGWKLVAGREGNREWLDPEAVVAEFSPVLGEGALFEHKILSPAKLEKILGKKHKIDHLVTRKPGELAIAKDRDPRAETKAVNRAQDAFALAVPAPLALAEDDLMAQLGGSSKKAPLWPS